MTTTTTTPSRWSDVLEFLPPMTLAELQAYSDVQLTNLLLDLADENEAAVTDKDKAINFGVIKSWVNSISGGGLLLIARANAAQNVAPTTAELTAANGGTAVALSTGMKASIRLNDGTREWWEYRAAAWSRLQVDSTVTRFQDDVADAAARAAYTLPTGQLHFNLRQATNGLTYSTIDGGVTWTPSHKAYVATNAALSGLTEMEENQLTHVLANDWLWKWTATNGWQVIDDRTGGGEAGNFTGNVPNNAARTALTIAGQYIVFQQSNRLFYRTVDGGTTWTVMSRRIEIDTEAVLATLTEMVENQLAEVAATNELWKYTAANGWQKIR